jgi:putative signal transducing protein
MSEHELVVVRTFSDRMEAVLAKSALEAAGIESMMRPDDVGGLRPHMSYTLGVELLVRAEDAQQADEILRMPARLQ